MSRVFFATELEAIATFWRIYRTDGVALAFTAHDRDLWFGGLLHRAAPGMVPSAIRHSSDLEPDMAEVQGALAHDAISAADLAAGRFDGARVEIGLADWETGEYAVLYTGTIDGVAQEAGRFSAELVSFKHELEADRLPRTSPTCRAAFCGPGCTLPASRYTHEAIVDGIDLARNSVSLASAPALSLLRDGWLRWVDGPQAGLTMPIVGVEGESLLLDGMLHADLAPGMRVLLREGCDHTIATCHARFANGLNFQGEPFLPGNDLLSRYGHSAG